MTRKRKYQQPVTKNKCVKNLDFYIAEGNKYLNLKDYGNAKDSFDRATKIDKKSKEAYYGKGISNSCLEDYQAAINDYNIALHLDNTYSDAYLGRGTVHYHLAEYGKAMEDYKNSIQYHKGNASSAYFGLAAVYEALSKKDLVIINSTKAIEYEEAYADAYALRATAYFNQAKYKEAIEDYNIAIELDGRYPKTRYLRGLSNYKLAKMNEATEYVKADAKYKDALNDFSRAIDIKGDFLEAYYKRARVYTKLGNCQAAIADFQKVIELDANHLKAQQKLEMVQGELQKQTTLELATYSNDNHSDHELYQLFAHPLGYTETSTSSQSYPATTNFGENLDVGLFSASLSQNSLTISSFDSQAEKISDSQIDRFFENDSESGLVLPGHNAGIVHGSAQQTLSGLLSETNHPPFLSKQQISPRLSTHQGNQIPNQLLLSGERSQQSASDTSPPAEQTTASASQERTAPPKKDKRKKAPANPSMEPVEIEFEPKAPPGEASETDDGYENFIGQPQDKNAIFIGDTNEQPKIPKKTTYSKQAKVKIGKWGEEHVYKKLLNPGAKYFKQKYPNYTFIEEYTQERLKQVWVKEKNVHGKKVDQKKEVIIKQHVQRFQDIHNPNNLVDVVWNNKDEESRLSNDFKVVESKDNQITSKHSIEVKTTTSDKYNNFKLSENESLKLFKSHNNPTRTYSIFRVRNAGYLNNKKPDVTIIEKPLEKIIKRELRVKSMTLNIS